VPAGGDRVWACYSTRPTWHTHAVAVTLIPDGGKFSGMSPAFGMVVTIRSKILTVTALALWDAVADA
jgi:hypothetical protein